MAGCKCKLYGVFAANISLTSENDKAMIFLLIELVEYASWLNLLLGITLLHLQIVSVFHVVLI